MARKKKKKTPRLPRIQWVYIMSNASMPGLLKIGMTTTSPQQRNRELGAATGVPTPFRLEYSLRVSNALRVERALHQELAVYRVNRRREFFEMDVKTAIRALKTVAKRRPFGLGGLIWLLAGGMEVLTALLLLYLGTGVWEHMLP
ncbi:GIY-YIG nuclease family protein [Pseudogemmobacter faecipullorum]|uniref:GIY-YIG nuclease family protein n=1 Tax=Pseudogemmobacter faecipullorum TaxID=2755041 RepID=A0ABS8CPJ5_9RHOB|nr:GIY-YIG nuclease family protein [Pseudogemmobacter faecipullorum]MCB5410750.1 GIY-YIG nuclease family protein [Pseudogemmobacter faecipullorum]